MMTCMQLLDRMWNRLSLLYIDCTLSHNTNYREPVYNYYNFWLGSSPTKVNSVGYALTTEHQLSIKNGVFTKFTMRVVSCFNVSAYFSVCWYADNKSGSKSIVKTPSSGLIVQQTVTLAVVQWIFYVGTGSLSSERLQCPTARVQKVGISTSGSSFAGNSRFNCMFFSGFTPLFASSIYRTIHKSSYSPKTNKTVQSDWWATQQWNKQFWFSLPDRIFRWCGDLF